MKTYMSTAALFAIALMNGCAAHRDRVHIAKMINQPTDPVMPALAPLSPPAEGPEATPLSPPIPAAEATEAPQAGKEPTKLPAKSRSASKTVKRTKTRHPRRSVTPSAEQQRAGNAEHHPDTKNRYRLLLALAPAGLIGLWLLAKRKL